MDNNNLDFLLSEFRSFGGIAENICQKNGKHGRGIFSLNPNQRSRIFAPSELIIKKEDIYLDSNHLRIKKNKGYSTKVREFFNYYQDNFSWGKGGKETTESFEKELCNFPSNFKELIKINLSVDIELRHKGKWDNFVKNQFLNCIAFNFRGNSVIFPLLELINHEVNSFPFIKRFNGISSDPLML